MDGELLLKYIKGEVTPEQRAQMVCLIEEDPKLNEMFSEMKARWVMENLPGTITPPEGATKIVNGHRYSHKRGNSIGTVLIKVAAVLFIPITVFALYLLMQNAPGPAATQLSDAHYLHPQQTGSMLEYWVNPGVKGRIMLPDSSEVWLNSGSVLRCPAQFDSLSRNVQLSGEAFFEVRSDSTWPMYVSTQKDITVKVTGTSFNVTSYDNDNDFRLTLVSGNVSLIKERTGEQVIVTPNEEIIVADDHGKIISKDADVYYNTAWKDGYLLFDNAPMETVINKVERWYGVKIKVLDNNILKYRYTASFNSESIFIVLELLKITSGINYRIDDNIVTLSFE